MKLRTSQKRPTSGEQNCRKQKLQSSDELPLSKAGKHPDFQVTLCLQNVSTNVDFAYIESE
jgi:hypothetical protein